MCVCVIRAGWAVDNTKGLVINLGRGGGIQDFRKGGPGDCERKGGPGNCEVLKRAHFSACAQRFSLFLKFWGPPMNPPPPWIRPWWGGGGLQNGRGASDVLPLQKCVCWGGGGGEGQV